MFTGIIEQTGRVKSVEKRGAFGRISVELGGSLKDCRLGDSIAVNGACLTATAISNGVFSADVSSESLGLTTLGSLRPGETVNVEFALTLSKPLGGHIVTGHVDGVGTISRKTREGAFMLIDVSVPPLLMDQLVKKGSVAVDGISLTVAELMDNGFRVAVVPHTLENTTLGSIAEGARVNIETDIIGKYVERFMRLPAKSGITETFLSDNGFFKRK